MAAKILLAIVDDHQIVIDGIKSLLHGLTNFHVVMECTKPELVPEQLKNNKVDILLTDVVMPVMNGAELAKIVRKEFPHIKILALSMSGQGDMVNQMIDDADISGYVLKNIGQKELINALEKIAGGGIYFSDEVLNEMVEKKVSEEELEKVKNKIEAYVTFGEVNVLNRAMNLAYFEMLGNLNEVNNEVEKYAAVTSTQMQQAAAKIFRKENSNTIRYFSNN